MQSVKVSKNSAKGATKRRSLKLSMILEGNTGNDEPSSSLELSENAKSLEDAKKSIQTDGTTMYDEEMSKVQTVSDDDFVEDFSGDDELLLRQEAARRYSLPFSLKCYTFDEDLFSLSNESNGPIEQKESTTRDDKFLENFSELPAMASNSSARSQWIPHGDGHFVDPLTGETIAINLSHMDGDHLAAAPEEAAVEIKESEDDFKVIFHEDFSLEELDELYDLAYKTCAIEESESAQALTLWKETVQVEKQSLPETKVEDIQKDINMEEEVTKFFDNMINAIVRRSEAQATERMLKNSLDKKKLYLEFTRTLKEILTEKKVQQFLDRKATEYFRRKGCFRQIDGDKAEDGERYAKVRQRLNEVLGAEQAMLKKTRVKIDELFAEHKKEEQHLKEEVEHLETFIRNILKREDMPHLQREVQRSLLHMRELRDEISAVRSVVIHRQHTLGRLHAKIEDLQDLGEGLHLSDYEGLLTQVNGLSKKLEDRINELNKSHHSFQHDVHALSHMKKKTELVFNQITIQIVQYNLAEDELSLSRRWLYFLNTKHNKIVHKIKDCRMRLGLIDKPALLKDYDDTVEQIKQRKIVIGDLRKTRLELERKIENFQRKPSTMGLGNKNHAVNDLETSFMVKGVKLTL